MLGDIVLFDRLLTAITSSQNVLEQSAAYLLFQKEYSADVNLLQSNAEFKSFESLPTRKLISMTGKAEPIK